MIVVPYCYPTRGRADCIASLSLVLASRPRSLALSPNRAVKVQGSMHHWHNSRHENASNVVGAGTRIREPLSSRLYERGSSVRNPKGCQCGMTYESCPHTPSK